MAALYNISMYSRYINNSVKYDMYASAYNAYMHRDVGPSIKYVSLQGMEGSMIESVTVGDREGRV